MIKNLKDKEKQDFHNIYRKNELFKHWFTILSLNRKFISTDPVSIWHASESVIEELRNDKGDRAEMIEYLIDDMLEKYDYNTITATMCVVLTRLANATEPGMEEDEHPNDSICIAIYRYYMGNPLFLGFLDKFESKQTDNYGKKVVFTPDDPLRYTHTLEDISSVLTEQMESTYQKIIDKTKPLRMVFGSENWEIWDKMWHVICFNKEWLDVLQKVSPNKNEWNLNQKFVCNVLGLFNQFKIHTKVKTLNDTLFTNNKYSYINNYMPGAGNSTELSKDTMVKIETILSELEE